MEEHDYKLQHRTTKIMKDQGAPNLGNYFSYRPRDPKDSKGNSITESPIQIIGRLHRPYTGEPINDFVKKWGYDLTKYVKNCSEEEIEMLKVTNSYNICVPDTAMWGAAIETIKKSYSPTLSRATAWITKLRKK